MVTVIQYHQVIQHHNSIFKQQVKVFVQITVIQLSHKVIHKVLQNLNVISVIVNMNYLEVFTHALTVVVQIIHIQFQQHNQYQV